MLQRKSSSSNRKLDSADCHLKSNLSKWLIRACSWGIFPRISSYCMENHKMLSMFFCSLGLIQALRVKLLFRELKSCNLFGLEYFEQQIPTNSLKNQDYFLLSDPKTAINVLLIFQFMQLFCMVLKYYYLLISLVGFDLSFDCGI